MRHRVCSALILRDGRGYFVEQYGATRFRGGLKKCKQVCGQLNKAAALERERHRRGMAAVAMWDFHHRGHLAEVGRGRIELCQNPAALNLAAFIPATLRAAH